MNRRRESACKVVSGCTAFLHRLARSGFGRNQQQHLPFDRKGREGPALDIPAESLEPADHLEANIGPKEAAEAAGLRYVSDSRPGIRRKRSGKGFCYVQPDGSKLSGGRLLRRIRSLAVPPAWTDVWICPFADGHIQARGGTPEAESSTDTIHSSAQCARARNTSTSLPLHRR